MKRPRDMTRAAYKEALERNGFEEAMVWLRDVSGQAPGLAVGTCYDRRTGKIDRRASLANAIRVREKHVEKAARDALQGSQN